MEDTLQRVFAILIAVIIFFLLPLYIAFEKKDDISYSLALRITTNFVENVKSKGYLSKEMYDNYIARLAVTGNVYDIKLEHVAKKYNPVIYSYNDDYSQIRAKFDYNTYKDQYENGEINSAGGLYKNLVLAYDLHETRYNEGQIIEALDLNQQVIKRVINGTTEVDNYKAVNRNDIPVVSGIYRTSDDSALYPMSKGDEFTVVIRNTNTTIASVLFNTLTFGANTGNDTKVYINYGGAIQSEEYRKNTID